MNNIIRNFDVLPLQEKNVYIAVCPDLGTVDQGNILNDALANLQQTTQVYLQELNVAFAPHFLVGEQIRNNSSVLLPSVSPDRFIAALERLGFTRTSQCVVLKKQSDKGEVSCAVPLRYPLASATIWNLLYSAGISRQEFLENL